jgi:hypothetical protein
MGLCSRIMPVLESAAVAAGEWQAEAIFFDEF